MKHLPNALTIVRMLVTPAVLVLLFSDSFSGRSWAATLFILASISDYLDGKLARHYGVGSALGQFLDPIADKVLVLGTFFGLAVLAPAIVPWWTVGLIAGRDLFVTALRVWHARQGRTLTTSGAAKTKTTFQLTFLIATLLLWAAMLLPNVVGRWAGLILDSWGITILLWATVVATLATGLAYVLRPNFETNDEQGPD
jgi:CDP-diacylglycerol--glycerol-3-phosphate 3-phosphatidyltransferase